MTLKSDTNFEEKLTLSSKNDIRNLVNFDGSCGKSGNLHIICKDPNFEEKLTFCLENDMRNLVNFNPSSRKSENLHFDGLLL